MPPPAAGRGAASDDEDADSTARRGRKSWLDATVARQLVRQRMRSGDVQLALQPYNASPVLSRAAQVQAKLQSKLKSSDPKYLLTLFRKCGPDEVGFVRSDSVHHLLQHDFGLSKRDVRALLGVDAQGAPFAVAALRLRVACMPDAELPHCSASAGEMDFSHFRKLVVAPIDMVASPPSPSPPARVEPARAQVGSRLAPVAKRTAQDMTVGERDEMRLRMRINRALERPAGMLRQVFERSSRDGALNVRTRYSFEELAEGLRRLGSYATAEELRRVYHDADGGPGGGLTLSQLVRHNEDYFLSLDGAPAVTSDPRARMTFNNM